MSHAPFELMTLRLTSCGARRLVCSQLAQLGRSNGSAIRILAAHFFGPAFCEQHLSVTPVELDHVTFGPARDIQSINHFG